MSQRARSIATCASVCAEQGKGKNQLVFTASLGLARPGVGPVHSATDSLSLFM